MAKQPLWEQLLTVFEAQIDELAKANKGVALAWEAFQDAGRKMESGNFDEIPESLGVLENRAWAMQENADYLTYRLGEQVNEYYSEVPFAKSVEQGKKRFWAQVQQRIMAAQ